MELFFDIFLNLTQVSDQQTIGQRLEEIIADKRVKSKRAFALSIGVDPSFFDKMVKGATSITAAYADKIAEKYGVNKEWLFTGTGPKYVSAGVLDPSPMQILSLLAQAFKDQAAAHKEHAETLKLQADILRSIESKMARQDTQEEISKRAEYIQANLESLSSGHQLVAIRQAVDRGILLRSLARLEGKKNDHALLSEADSKINEIEAESVRLSKRHAADKSSTEKSK